MTIKWKLPDVNEPGYLRRRRDLLKILDDEASKEGLVNLVKFLVPYVEVEEGEDPVEVLLDVSQSEYARIVLYFLGYSNMVSDPKGESSVPQ